MKRRWEEGGGGHSRVVFYSQVRIRHETYPSCSEQSARLVFLVGDMEMRDRLAGSNLNKLLYQYTTEAMPKQSHASMVSRRRAGGSFQLEGGSGEGGGEGRRGGGER